MVRAEEVFLDGLVIVETSERARTFSPSEPNVTMMIYQV
jgi:hypothetical protein